MAHLKAYVKAHRLLQTVLRLGGKRHVIYLPRVGSKIDFMGQALRIVPDPLEQIHHVAVQVIDRLNVAPWLIKQDRSGAKERLQVAVVFREATDDPPRQPPFAPRVL